MNASLPAGAGPGTAGPAGPGARRGTGSATGGRRRRSGPRSALAGALVLLFALVLPLTVTAAWAHRVALNTDGYVAAVRPLAGDPAVTAAVSRELADQIYTALDPSRRLAAVLPAEGAAVAGPVGERVQRYLRTSVQRLLDGPQFAALWGAANRTAHAQLLAVLRGRSASVTTTDGQVVLNLVPVLRQALAQVSTRASALLGTEVRLPEVSAAQLPATACARIGAALGRPLPSDCAQIPLFPAEELTRVRRAVTLFDSSVLLLLVLAPVLFLAALAVSVRRRRTLAHLTVAGMLGLSVTLAALTAARVHVSNQVEPAYRAAASAVLRTAMSSLVTASAWLLAAGLVVLLVVALTGRGPIRGERY